MSYPHKDIIDQIKLERKRQGITQTELANLLGCPQPSIVRIETRKISPTIGILQRICDILGMDITLIKKEKINKKLILIFNDIPNGYDEFIIKLFKPYFREISVQEKIDKIDKTRLSETEWINILKDDKSGLLSLDKKEIILNITSDLNIYFDKHSQKEAWKIGNIKDDEIDDIVRTAVEEDIPALLLAKSISTSELIKKYGDINSNNRFSLEEYKIHLLNQYIDDKYSNKKELEKLLKKINK